MRIAIAVENDDKTIAVRMGHAPSFSVFTLKPGEVIEDGIFPNEHAEHHHHGAGHKGGHHHHGEDKEEIQEHRRQLGELRNCDAVIVRGIGPNMKQALLLEGIKIYRAKKSLGNEAFELVAAFQENSGSFREEM